MKLIKLIRDDINDIINKYYIIKPGHRLDSGGCEEIDNNYSMEEAKKSIIKNDGSK